MNKNSKWYVVTASINSDVSVTFEFFMDLSSSHDMNVAKEVAANRICKEYGHDYDDSCISLSFQ